jgi:hypothetical protein
MKLGLVGEEVTWLGGNDRFDDARPCWKVRTVGRGILATTRSENLKMLQQSFPQCPLVSPGAFVL